MFLFSSSSLPGICERSSRLKWSRTFWMIKYAMNVKEQDVEENLHRFSVQMSLVSNTTVNIVGPRSIQDPVGSFINLWSKKEQIDPELFLSVGVKSIIMDWHTEKHTYFNTGKAMLSWSKILLSGQGTDYWMSVLGGNYTSSLHSSLPIHSSSFREGEFRETRLEIVVDWFVDCF